MRRGKGHDISSADPDQTQQTPTGAIPARAQPLTGTGTLQESKRAFEYVVRSLLPGDVPQLYLLHREILKTLASPLLLYERSEAFFAECVGGRGCVVGAFAEGRMIGYAAGWAPGVQGDSYGKDIDIEEAELDNVAHLAGSSIHPRYRGNQLHTPLVGLRADVLHAADFFHQCGEVVPGNVHSIRNHFDSGYLLKGYRIDDFRFDTKGVPHFILHRDTRSAPRRLAEANPPTAPIRDIETYRAMLAAGRWGYRIRDIEGEALLCYGRFEA